MENLQIEKAYENPSVNFDADKGLLEIEGGSIPEDADKFYTRLLDWIEQYSKKPKEKTHVRLYFYYFNTVTAKYIVKILKKLESFYKQGNELTIEWQYEKDDEDMEKDGEEIAEIVNVPIKIVCVDD